MLEADYKLSTSCNFERVHNESMTDDRAALLARPRAALREVRADPSRWDGEFDYGLLLAMHFDGADLPLARRMLGAVVRYHRATVPAGVSHDLVRAGLLVAGHRAVEDVWSHWEALRLGFDPAGYRPMLAAAGLDVTRSFVAASQHPDRRRVLATLAELREEQVSDWLRRQRERFPTDPAAESLLGWATHARELGEPDLAHRFLHAWARTRPHDRTTFLTLRTRLGRLGFLAEAAAAQQEVVALTTGRRRLADELIALAGLYREAGDVARARQALEEGAANVPAEERGPALAGRIERERGLLA